MAREKKKMSNRARILMRYGIISACLMFFAVLIVFQLFKTTVVHAEEWNRTADEIMKQVKVLAPERGNILADNGNILACNLTVYDINFDMRHQKVRNFGKKIPWASIDSLADSLDVYFPLPGASLPVTDKESDDSWHQKFRREFAKDASKRPRAMKLVKKGSLDDFERIKQFPFFRDFSGKGTRNPVYVDSKTVRIYPFGKMAYRSIGRVSEIEGEIHGYSGLERDIDSLLYGREGYAKKVMMTNGIGHMVDRAPVRGNDVQTTISIDLQDVLEEELTKVCVDNNAFWGTAILMEVATGEIKAIANVQHMDDGSYGEALNRAVRGFEPGSVMKPISMMIAFEDGLIKSVNDMVDCSPFQKTSDPHAPTVKSARQVIEMSSNTGISRIMFRGYSKDPEAYHERLRSIGFFDPMHSGIAGEETPYFPPVGEKDIFGNRQTLTARHLTLARQCYGYSATVPPLYTLAFYNAIANGGMLVKPHMVKKLIREDGRDSVINIADLSTRICSEETARKMQECLLQPVWGDHGTARRVRDDRVRIAGKTGTAFPIPEGGGTYDTSKRRFAFAGYFPADNPKYSCIALILAPSGGGAGSTSGQVVKNVALKLYSRGLLDNISTFTASASKSTPVISLSDKKKTAGVRNRIGAEKSATFTDKYDRSESGKVPDLAGYDLESALRILEKRGFKVSVEGAGYVVSQLPEAGSPARSGSKVHLRLSI